MVGLRRVRDRRAPRGRVGVRVSARVRIPRRLLEQALDTCDDQRFTAALGRAVAHIEEAIADLRLHERDVASARARRLADVVLDTGELR